MQKLLKIKSKAEDSFLQKNYRESMSKYSNILVDYPDDKDAQIGVILSDMAIEKEEEAQALFDYYLILKKKTPTDAADILKGVIESFDSNANEITKTLEQSFENKALETNGILYSDFKELVNKQDFKSVFKRVMFSTKIVILNKNEFIQFLQQLIEHDFDSMALNYIESAIEIFMYDADIQKLCDKLRKKNIEN